MLGRELFIEHALEVLTALLIEIEGRETFEPDLATIKELSEQLLDEVQSLDK